MGAFSHQRGTPGHIRPIVANADTLRPVSCKVTLANLHRTIEAIGALFDRATVTRTHRLRPLRRKRRDSLQGYLAHNKERPPRTLQQDYA